MLIFDSIESLRAYLQEEKARADAKEQRETKPYPRGHSTGMSYGLALALDGLEGLRRGQEAKEEESRKLVEKIDQLALATSGPTSVPGSGSGPAAPPGFWTVLVTRQGQDHYQEVGQYNSKDAAYEMAGEMLGRLDVEEVIVRDEDGDTVYQTKRGRGR